MNVREPKFQIGQVVKHKLRRMPMCEFFVNAILIEICPGGTQVHYLARQVFQDGGIGGATIKLNEEELHPVMVDGVVVIDPYQEDADYGPMFRKVKKEEVADE